MDLDYCDIEWFGLEMNRAHSVVFEIASKYCISDFSRNLAGTISENSCREFEGLALCNPYRALGSVWGPEDMQD